MAGKIFYKNQQRVYINLPEISKSEFLISSASLCLWNKGFSDHLNIFAIVIWVDSKIHFYQQALPSIFEKTGLLLIYST